MKSAEELRELYDAELKPHFTGLEAKRKAVVKDLLKLGVLLFVVFVVLAGGLFALGAPPELAFVVLAILVVIGAWRYKSITRDYVAIFKRDVIGKIVAFIDSGLSYTPDHGIGRGQFMGAEIFTKTPERYNSEDYVAGTLDKTLIQFSEVHAEDRQTYHDSKGRRRTKYVTIFRGIFYIADFNKHFNGKTFVLPDTAQKLLGTWLGGALQSKNISRPDLVTLEDPEFEKAFVVYGSDQVEARYILSTSLMRRILDFKNKTGKSIYLSFINNNVHIAIPYKKNLFEPSIFSSCTDYAHVEEYYRDLALAAGIVEDLNLNTRIWTKR